MSCFRFSLGGALLASCAAAALGAQTGANSGGAVRLAQETKLANHWQRVLMIGAHPDDEDTQLLTVLARGAGMHTAYLSLTRGDGGQNLIGPELGEALGVLRTEELAAARRLDGGEQFFTRAFDFGFSKSADESLLFWGHDEVLKDVVRIIRRFRPQVIISVWTGTPADGHGHHTAAGILAREAFSAAGDSMRFPELARENLTPWQPAKFYLSARGGGGATLTFDAGAIDPATGMTYRQIAARSRSQHRSQNQGGLEELGPARSGIRLVERAPGISGNDDSLFAGIKAEPITQPDAHAAEAALTERNIVVDATTEDDELVPGQELPITMRLWNAGRDTAFVTVRLIPHPGYATRGEQCAQRPQAVAPGAMYTCAYTLAVWPTAAATSPYYTEMPIRHNLYDWSHAEADIRGLPSAPPLEATFTVGRSARPSAEDLRAVREVEARFRDPVIGEVRRPLRIVPRIALDVQPNRMLWTLTRRTHPFRVELEHLARDASDATVSLQLPAGWTSSPAQHFHFAREGERATAQFTVTAPTGLKAGKLAIGARAVVGTDTIATGIYRIRYPNVRPQNIATAAQALLVAADVKFPPLGTVGYVRGGGDVVPEALVNAGIRVDLLSGDSLERGSLAKYHVIVIGPRAYEADPSLVRAHPRLMRWLNDGGTLLVQYQQTPFTAGGFAPRPLTIVAPTQSRVTEEDASVTMLAPTHQALNTPNRIGPKDFEGWVQERGLDFPTQWDPAWTPLLEMHDSGDVQRPGGLLVARVGRGTAIYTGLSFHRELPALVPGAWRLFVNLLGLGESPAPATRARR